MGLLRGDPAPDDVDVDSCLANLHRLDHIRPARPAEPVRVVDLRSPSTVDGITAERRTAPA